MIETPDGSLYVATADDLGTQTPYWSSPRCEPDRLKREDRRSFVDRLVDPDNYDVPLRFHAGTKDTWRHVEASEVLGKIAVKRFMNPWSDVFLMPWAEVIVTYDLGEDYDGCPAHSRFESHEDYLEAVTFP